MSVKTWQEEFYTRPRKKMTKLEAIEQSLKKYEGVTQKNLRKHDVELDGNWLVPIDPIADHDDFVFDMDSCALCKKYSIYKNDHIDGCGKCPLNVPGSNCFNYNSPFEKFMAGDTRPMRTVLRKLLVKEQGRL